MSLAGALTVGLWMNAAAALVTPEIRVRLKRAKDVVQVSGRDLQITPPGRFATRVSLAPVTFRKARVRAQGRGHWEVTWDGEGAPQELTGARLWIKGRDVRLGIEPAPFELELVATRGAHLDVVAHLGMDEYLAGVLPAEMPILWPIEALKAQAVAARSFALTLARERRRTHFDVDSNITDQVYRFVAETRRHPERAAKLRKVITETSDEVLMDTGGRVLRAHYSADCGCTTEDPRHVWGGSNGLQSTLDPTCGLHAPIQWSRSVTRAEAARRLARAFRLPADAQLTNLSIASRTPTGRVASVTAVMTLGQETTPRALDANAFRRAFGYRRIRSANFSLAWTGDDLTIAGSGVGHGVGLCQTGAKAMAERGSTYRAILKQYYPGASLGRRDRI